MYQPDVPELFIVLIRHDTSDAQFYRPLLVLFLADMYRPELKKKNQGRTAHLLINNLIAKVQQYIHIWKEKLYCDSFTKMILLGSKC